MPNNLHIAYDLMQPGQNYEKVIAKIKTLGGWARVEQSFWYVDSHFTATQARDLLIPTLDKGDKLYVVDASNGQAAWHGMSTEVTEFIKRKW